jgi:predicted phosphodiesterase
MELENSGRESVLQIALLGGVYNNYLALEATLQDASQRGCDEIYCLGDLGAFGPYPDRVFPLLDQYNVTCVQGNYDDSIGNGLDNCQCGYTDPRDNHFAQLSFDYTLANTSSGNRAYLRQLPKEIRLERYGLEILLCHGSPRRINEFLWESATSTQFLEYLGKQHQADIIVGTHTGIKWLRQLADQRWFCNSGVVGRPENDGVTNVWYTILDIQTGHHGSSKRRALENVSWRHVPIHYDYRRLACEMEQEAIPTEFIETIRSGWWTTCLEVLPGKERRRGRF